jgi:hypothetical protein
MYILLEWRKRPKKKNLLTTLFVGILLMNTYLQADKMNSVYILRAFEADTVVVQTEASDVSIEVEEIFAEYNFIHSHKEGLLSRIKNIGEDEYFKLVFYDEGNKIIQMRVYEVDEGTGYSGLVNGIPVVIKCRGDRLKFDDEFYMTIEDSIKGELSL